MKNDRSVSITNSFTGCFIVFLSLAGCTTVNDFPMGESHYQIKQVQILDPQAAERNDGIILNLDGTYGEAVMKSYRESNVKPGDSKSMGSIRANSSGRSSGGGS